MTRCQWVIVPFGDETITSIQNGGSQLFNEAASHPSKPSILRIEEYFTGFLLCNVNKAGERYSFVPYVVARRVACASGAVTWRKLGMLRTEFISGFCIIFKISYHYLRKHH